MSEACSRNRIWVFLAILFLLISIGLAAYIIYFHVSNCHGDDESIPEQFPGYFRTPEEQKEYEQKFFEINRLQNLRNATPVVNRTLSSCFFRCAGNLTQPVTRQKREARVLLPFMEYLGIYSDVHDSPSSTDIHHRRKRQGTTGHSTYNGCCISTFEFIAPTSLLNADDENVTVLQYPPLQEQIFLVQRCSHAIGCTGCGCASETSLITAVIEGPKIGLVKIPSCCKCFNNVDPPTSKI